MKSWTRATRTSIDVPVKAGGIKAEIPLGEGQGGAGRGQVDTINSLRFEEVNDRSSQRVPEREEFSGT